MYDGHCRRWNLSCREIIWNFLPNWYDQSNEIVFTKRIPTNKTNSSLSRCHINRTFCFARFVFFFHIHYSPKLVNLVCGRQFSYIVIIGISMKYEHANKPTTRLWAAALALLLTNSRTTIIIKSEKNAEPLPYHPSTLISILTHRRQNY